MKGSMQHTTDHARISAGLARIQQSFLSEAEARCARLRVLRQQLSEMTQDQAALKEIGQITHKIAGTAATLGYPELGVQASEIDDAIDQRDPATGAPSPDLLAKIDSVISALALLKPSTQG